jgi:hypothetical protein
MARVKNAVASLHVKVSKPRKNMPPRRPRRRIMTRARRCPRQQHGWREKPYGAMRPTTCPHASLKRRLHACMANYVKKVVASRTPNYSVTAEGMTRTSGRLRTHPSSCPTWLSQYGLEMLRETGGGDAEQTENHGIKTKFRASNAVVVHDNLIRREAEWPTLPLGS